MGGRSPGRHYVRQSGRVRLGYRDPGELLGKPSHETVHYKRHDGTLYPEAQCPMLRPRQTGQTVR